MSNRCNISSSSIISRRLQEHQQSQSQWRPASCTFATFRPMPWTRTSSTWPFPLARYGVVDVVVVHDA